MSIFRRQHRTLMCASMRRVCGMCGEGSRLYDITYKHPRLCPGGSRVVRFFVQTCDRSASRPWILYEESYKSADLMVNSFRVVRHFTQSAAKCEKLAQIREEFLKIPQIGTNWRDMPENCVAQRAWGRFQANRCGLQASGVEDRAACAGKREGVTRISESLTVRGIHGQDIF